MFDIIGDIHGQAERLHHLLVKLGYQQSDQGYTHPQYKAIFVGDLIDRGPYQLETLQIVKDMVDNNNAYVVMGNHEFNAIGWSIPSKAHTGEFLRRHNSTHYKQHNIFLTQVAHSVELYQYWINWFKSLPLFLNFPSFRVIHACWDNDIIHKIMPYLTENNCLKESSIQQAFSPSDALFNYCEVLLKGKEITLPDGIYYRDKEGTVRHKSRIKWWLSKARNINELCILPDNQIIPELDKPVNCKLDAYSDDKPIFFGHYWLTGTPSIQAENIVCVDYSAAIKSGKLVAYRWSGENRLTNHHFIY